MKQQEIYFEFMDSNPPLLDSNNNEVVDIMAYLKLDDEGRPYTNDDGSAVLNKEGQKLLKDNKAYVEPLDTLHEKGLTPVVKILMENSGEHIYNMFTGKIDLDPKTKGTPNRAKGPYKGSPEAKLKSKAHGEFDVITWIPFGSSRDDNQEFLGKFSRVTRSIYGLFNPTGSPYRNIEGEHFSEDSKILYLQETEGLNK